MNELKECVELVKESNLKQSVIVLMEIISGMQDDITMLRDKVQTLEDTSDRKTPKGEAGGFSIG